MFYYCKRSQAIVVTEDSNSMITEAICCRKPVLVLAPPQNAMNADENAYLQELADNGWLSRMVLDECGTFDRMQERLKAVRPLEFNHLDVLAERLRQPLVTADMRLVNAIRAEAPDALLTSWCH